MLLRNFIGKLGLIKLIIHICIKLSPQIGVFDILKGNLDSPLVIYKDSLYSFRFIL